MAAINVNAASGKMYVLLKNFVIMTVTAPVTRDIVTETDKSVGNTFSNNFESKDGDPFVSIANGGDPIDGADFDGAATSYWFNDQMKRAAPQDAPVTLSYYVWYNADSKEVGRCLLSEYIKESDVLDQLIGM